VRRASAGLTDVRARAARSVGVRASQKEETCRWCTLTKNGHSATAHVKAVDGVGLELRFMIDDTLYFSQIFRDWPLLGQAAREKRSDFESRGWE
jgi:hypothetical protein